MPGYGPINHFTDLEAWKICRKLRTEIYKTVILFPDEEKYNLKSQMRRAAISITANIAEGYGRFHFQENIQFCRLSRGSLYELHDHLISSLDLEYITRIQYDFLYDLVVQATKTLNGYIRWLKKQKLENNES